VSKVQDQIAALTRHLYEQHQASKSPVEVEEIRVNVLGGGVESITVHKPRSVPLAPGVHPPPMMGPRFIPGAVAVQQRVSTKAEALEAVERMFEDSPFEDDVPSIDVPAEKKNYKRKLEP
jgi:hypothetical protein